MDGLPPPLPGLTDRQRAVLESWWRGDSYSQIGRALGLNRNQVSSTLSILRIRVEKAGYAMPRRASPIKAPAEPQFLPDRLAVIRRAIAALTGCSCRWPEGDVGAADFRFCGAPSPAGAPYCAVHHARAYFSRVKQKAEKNEAKGGYR